MRLIEELDCACIATTASATAEMIVAFATRE
jgi:hypothetical protein